LDAAILSRKNSAEFTPFGIAKPNAGRHPNQWQLAVTDLYITALVQAVVQVSLSWRPVESGDSTNFWANVR
jgi:hypothetical protein